MSGLADIGWRIRRLRLDRGLCQLELALECETSQKMVSRWETGLSVPSARSVAALAEALGCSADFLLGIRP